VTDPQQPFSRREARENAQSTAGGATPAGGGPGSVPSRNKVALIAGALAAAFLLLGTGAVFAGIAAGKGSQQPATTPGGTSSSAPTRDVAADQVAAATIPTCSISRLTTASALKKAFGSVVDVSSGDSLYSLNDTSAQRPASGEKVLTAAAAIAVLGPNYRIATQVVDGVTPGSITLIGQGDATLSREPAGKSIYAGAPTMAALAAATQTAYDAAHPGVPITQVILDSSYWDPADNWIDSWPRSEQTGGFLSEVTALQVDGDRANPKFQVSPRGTDPVSRAGNAFVAALGNPNITLVDGHAENGAPQLAKVQSQPVKTLVRQMLLASDNTLAEMLARIVSVRENMGGTSGSLQNAITSALSKYGIDTSDLAILDGSGESDEDAVPALYMAKLMAAISQKQDGLQYVADGMPLAGKTGGLTTRFTGANAIAVGKIYAKPGSIASAYTLSGYLTARDGTKLAFAFYGIGSGITTSAQPALDSLATAVYKCGKNLTTS
jgi:D-alanyl-D-alanine carboxypeptidase/D-alanyl-D-alanine-endopeptidase (penicillin-binding protein 4)